MLTFVERRWNTSAGNITSNCRRKRTNPNRLSNSVEEILVTKNYSLIKKLMMEKVIYMLVLRTRIRLTVSCKALCHLPKLTFWSKKRCNHYSRWALDNIERAISTFSLKSMEPRFASASAARSLNRCATSPVSVGIGLIKYAIVFSSFIIRYKGILLFHLKQEKWGVFC